jgi:hypothetical protein
MLKVISAAAAGSWMVATGAGDFNTAWLDRVNKGYGI